MGYELEAIAAVVIGGTSLMGGIGTIGGTIIGAFIMSVLKNGLNLMGVSQFWQMVAMGELLIIAQKAGADPQKVVQAIKGGAAQCWALDIKPPRLFDGNRQPGFKAYMQAKDLNIVLDTAREYGVPLPGTAANTQLFSAMLEMGMGDLDNSAVVGVIEALAGEKLRSN